MKNQIVIIILLLFCSSTFAQRPRNFKDLDEAKKYPDSVQWLTVRDKGLETYPAEIKLFRNLRYLDLLSITRPLFKAEKLNQAQRPSFIHSYFVPTYYEGFTAHTKTPLFIFDRVLRY